MPEAGVPKPSRRLAKLMEKLAQDPVPVVDRVMVQLRADIPDYEHAPPALLRDVRDSVTFMHRLWYETLLSGERPSAATLETVAASGRRRVHQGVQLDALLRAFRLGSKLIWAGVLEGAGDDAELHRELLFDISPFVFDHFDQMAQTIAQAFGAEQMLRARWRDALAHELCSILFNRPDNEEGFRRNAEALGLDPAAAHCAQSLRLKRADAAPAELEGEVERLMVSIARVLRTQSEHMLHTLHRGQVLLWLPLLHGETVVAGEQRLAGQAGAVLEACPAVTAIGVGLPAVGARGWRASADQALKAQEYGAAQGEAVLRYADIALNDAVAGADNVTRYFDALVERLAQEPQLLGTLEAYFERRQHRKAAAAALDIHPNTLNYRLERIETLLGAKLDEVGWLAKLHTALRLRRGRPAL
jgi:sugar diacid utilization regulator